MRHICKVTVLERKVFSGLQREYLANPESDAEREWLDEQDFGNRPEDAYTG